MIRSGRQKFRMSRLHITSDLGRFELFFATINGPEFLIVVTNPSSGMELVFTELEAFRLAATEDGTTISDGQKHELSNEYRRQIQDHGDFDDKFHVQLRSC